MVVHLLKILEIFCYFRVCSGCLLSLSPSAHESTSRAKLVMAGIFQIWYLSGKAVHNYESSQGRTLDKLARS